MLTILTPTYNRAAELVTLYESLKNQTCRDFCWLIVNDGSTDGTEDEVKAWKAEADFDISYIKKSNGGKHTCLNLGISWIKTELTMIVDSDDHLTADAVEIITKVHETYKDLAGICGYSFLRGFPDGGVNGSEFPDDYWITDYITARVNSGDMNADKAEVFRTECLRQYPFPEIKGEKFIGEDVVWMRMARKYQMVHVNEVIYIGEYLSDGLTNTRRARNIACPKGCVLRALEYMKPDVAPRARMKGSIQYIVYGRFAGLTVEQLIEKARFKSWAKAAAGPGEMIYRTWSRKLV